MRKSELNKEDCSPYYWTYIDALADVGLADIHQRQLQNFPEFIANIPDGKLHFAYDEGKWTIAEVLLHLIDTERIFQYRALRFARNDGTALPGFDQDVYVPGSFAHRRSKESIIEEYRTVRKSTIALFSNFDRQTLQIKGTASGAQMSVAAVGFIISGHQRHHRNVIRERYL